MDGLHTYDTDSLMRYIANASRPVIVTHMKPDGDAMGCSIAMYHFLGLAGKSQRKIILNDSYPHYLDFLVDSEIKKDISIYSDKPASTLALIEESDLIICMDFNAFHRTENLQHALAQAACPKVLIDHHLNPDIESFNIVYSKADISSASELLYQILMSTPIIDNCAKNLPIKCSTALMTGMTTDTNNFANSVFPSTLQMASSLLAVGVDRDVIISNIYQQYRENRLRLLGHILKDVMKITNEGVAYIILPRQTIEKYNVQEGDTESFVNMPLTIKRVKMSIFIKEDGDKARVSIRSKKGVSANRCASMFFHGGGHENASGGRLFFNDDVAGIDDVETYILKNAHLFMTEDNKD